MLRATASKIFFSLIVITALAFTPRVVFAQHGGGGHGGGGGFHGGGGGFRGGGSAGRGRSFSGATGRSFGVAPSAPRSRGGFSPQRGENSFRSSPGNAATARNTGSALAAGGRSTAAAPSDGQWHSFERQRAAPVNTGSIFAGGVSHAATPVSGPTPGAVTRSFAGQGSEIRETTSRFGISAATQPSPGMAGVGPATAITAARMNSSQMGGSALAGSRAWNTTRRPIFVGTHADRFSSFGTVGLFPARGRRFGFGFRPFPIFQPFFGFGLGFGFGWDSCWAWDPFCFDSFSAWPPYGYYSYPPSAGYDPNYPTKVPDYTAPPEPSLSVRSNSANLDEGTSANAADGSTAPVRLVIIYLKDGTSFSPSDYWLADNQLHYVLGGAESTIDIDRVDLGRSNDENHKNGVKFLLKSAPNPSPAPSDAPPPAAADKPVTDAPPGPPANDNAR